MAILVKSIPLPILFISVFFFFIPPLSYIMTAYSFNIPLQQPSMIFSRFSWLTYLFFFLSICIGFGLLKAKKWAFYLFIIFSAAILLNNFYFLGKILFFSPKNFSQFSTGGIILNTFFTLLILGGIFYFLQEEISAPYLSILPRGWRNNIRDTIPLPLKITSSAGTTISVASENISANGVFLKLPDYNFFKAGEFVEIVIFPDEKDPVPLHFKGEVTRTIEPDEGSPGVGIKFLNEGNYKESKKSLREFLDEEYAPRYEILMPATFEIAESQVSHNCKFYNLSSNGSYLESDVLPQKGEKVILIFRNFAIPRKIPATVVWTNPKGAMGKPIGFGAKFEKNALFSLFPLLWKLALRGQIRR